MRLPPAEDFEDPSETKETESLRHDFDRRTIEHIVRQGAGLVRHLLGPDLLQWRLSLCEVQDRVQLGRGIDLTLVFDRAEDVFSARQIFRSHAARWPRCRLEAGRSRTALVLRLDWNTASVRREIGGFLAVLAGVVGAAGALDPACSGSA